MTTIISKLNDAYIRIDSEPHILKEIAERFSFTVPAARFSPAVKKHHWDGKIRLFNLRTNTIYYGCINKVIEFLEEKHYDYSMSGIPGISYCYDSRSVDCHIKAFEESGSTGIQGIREAQRCAIQEGIKSRRCVLLSPTASGKSLVIYLLSEYFRNVDGLQRGLVIVPRTSLVEQLYTDCLSYGADPEHYHRLYHGKEKTTSKPIIISTWQSIFEEPREWFECNDFVIVDECHGADAKSLINIMANKCIDVPVRIGLSGTLEDSKVHRLVLEGLFGPIIEVAKTHELIKKEQLSALQIQCIVLKYKGTIEKLNTYQDEISYIVSHTLRNSFLCKLAESLDGNTLILCNLIEKHLLVLEKLLKEKSKKPVYIVHGSVDTDIREEIRTYVDASENNAIILASYGTFQTGINIKRLHNIVFASPSKSKIRVLQSIGRGLRLGDGKQTCNVYDIVDDLRGNNTKNNYTLNHYVERVKLYIREKFEYRVHNVIIK